MPDDYKYVMISRWYFCLQQNFVRLFWYFYFYGKSLELHTGRNRIQLMKTIGRLIQCRLNLPRNRIIVELPVFGNLCLAVHRGYKIFDFNRKTVVKIMRPEIDFTTASNEIDAVRTASCLDFAPAVRRWNLEERWYAEDFIHGRPFYSHPGAKTNVFLEIYHHQITSCLEKMILLQPAQMVGIQTYVNRLLQKAANRRSLVSAANHQESDSIFEFVGSLEKWILQKANGKIPLIFSHGDFSLVNILKTANGLKVIDWEAAAKRNPLYDLYNYFLTESYYRRTTKCLVFEINEAIQSLQSRLAIKSPQIAATFESFSDIYRWLYYIERVGMLLERTINSKILEVTKRSIQVFNTYEENLAKV